MKSLDVDIAKVEQLVAASGNAQGQEQVKKYMEQRRQMENNYDQFVSGLYDRRLTEQERLILRVTRSVWRMRAGGSTGVHQGGDPLYRQVAGDGAFRARREARAGARDTRRKIAEEFLGQNLPPQFFYLAMQESDFEPFRSGPPTRMGFAKGMWQFIPETGSTVRSDDRTAGGVSDDQIPRTTGTIGRRPRARRRATSRTSMPPTRRRRACW